VLLAYGSMHDQKIRNPRSTFFWKNCKSTSSAPPRSSLCSPPIWNAAAPDAWPPSLPSPEIADAAPTTSTVPPKGALSLFLQGLRSRLHPAGVRVITIKPGPVQTPMTDHLPNAARFADPEQVARDIVRALERRSPDVLYTPKVWRYVMTAVQQIPETIFKRLSF
jgi:hypothetical protein